MADETGTIGAGEVAAGFASAAYSTLRGLAVAGADAASLTALHNLDLRASEASTTTCSPGQSQGAQCRLTALVSGSRP